MCVLQVTPALDAGGVERTTLEVAEALVRAGHRALVACRGGRLEGELAALGGELIPMPLDTKNPLTAWANAGRLAALVNAERVDIVHARSRAPAWSALIAARRVGVPFVTTYHGVYNARSGLKRFYNSVMARGDVVIANSHFTRAHVLAEHGVEPDRVVTIPRGADLNRFDPAAISPRRMAEVRTAMGVEPGDKRPIVLAPARLTAWKGQEVMIEAAAILAKSHAVVTVLAGDAQGREAYAQGLRARADALGIGADVRIPGHVADMPAALAVSAAAAFPSLEPEAFGRGAVEAQAMGVPVVAAGHGGLAETVIDGVTGRLTAPGDAAALARGVAEMLDLAADERIRMSRTARAHVESKYSARSLQEATLRVYGEVLARERA